MTVLYKTNNEKQEIAQQIQHKCINLKEKKR